jgi:cytoskeletal protein CcmA (bactofilin family)
MKRMHKRWWLLAGALVALLTLFAAAPARAAEIRSNSNAIVGRDEVIAGDLYATGSTVTIDGTVKGDLVALGGQVMVNGVVEGDVLAAGQSVVIAGRVGDDVRAAGQALVIGSSARVAGDLAAAGLSLETQSGSTVGGDVLVGAYQALLAGNVGQNIRGDLDRLELRGIVGGDVDVDVSGDQQVSAIQFSPAGQVPIPNVPSGLTVASSARIAGKLNYRSTAEATVSAGSSVGGISFDRQVAPQGSAQQATIPWLGYVRRLATLLLLGLLLLWLLPAWTKRMADSIETRPLPSMGWGVIAFLAFLAGVIGLVIATVVLAILFGYLTLGGLVALVISVGLLMNATLVVGYIAFTAYLAEIVVAFVAGRWLLRRAQPAWLEQPFAPLALGLVVYVALSAVPWLGTIVGLVVVLLGLGALWQWGRAIVGRGRPTPAPVVGLQPA